MENKSHPLKKKKKNTHHFFHLSRLIAVKRKVVEMPSSEKIWGKEILDPLVFNLKYLSLGLNKRS